MCVCASGATRLFFSSYFYFIFYFDTWKFMSTHCNIKMLIDQQLCVFFLDCHDDSKRVHFEFEYEYVYVRYFQNSINQKRVHVHCKCTNFIFNSVFVLLPSFTNKLFAVAHAIYICQWFLWSLLHKKCSLMPKIREWILDCEFLAHHFKSNKRACHSHSLIVLMRPNTYECFCAIFNAYENTLFAPIVCIFIGHLLSMISMNGVFVVALANVVFFFNFISSFLVCAFWITHWPLKLSTRVYTLT